MRITTLNFGGVYDSAKKALRAARPWNGSLSLSYLFFGVK